MPMPAARMTDNVLHDAPHCHAPIHPPAPTPTPVPHPPVPLMISKGQPNVLIQSLPAARATDMTIPCMVPPCVPGGPGLIAKASMTVMTGSLPQARLMDMVAFASCVAPIPSPTGKIMFPGCATVLVGG